MATDSVIQFRYSDDVHLVAIYKRYDSFPEKIIGSLKSYLKKTKNRQWDFIVAEIISRFVEDSDDRKGVKMLYRMPLKEDESFIYLWEVFPKEEYFRDEAIPFEKSIHVRLWIGNKRELLYDGAISDFKATK